MAFWMGALGAALCLLMLLVSGQTEGSRLNRTPDEGSTFAGLFFVFFVIAIVSLRIRRRMIRTHDKPT